MKLNQLLIMNKLKQFFKFLFIDKTVYPVFGTCGLFHVFIFWKFTELFSYGWLIPTFVITMTNIGVTLCILYGIRKYRAFKSKKS